MLANNISFACNESCFSSSHNSYESLKIMLPADFGLFSFIAMDDTSGCHGGGHGNQTRRGGRDLAA